MKQKPKRHVRTHVDATSGIIVFKLLEGKRKMRTIRTFGYGPCHGQWVKIEDYHSGLLSMTPQSPSMVKEEIASWVR